MPNGAAAAHARALEDPFNAFLHVPDALAEPEDGLLAGLALSVKDNLAVEAMPLTCASRHLASYVAPYTATVVDRLIAAGAVVVGKTNMDEFACGSSGESSAFGPTRNPAAPDRVPGGSSSGAAASVAAGAADVALGTDTGGSVRCPAAFCGVVGFKPTNRRVSRHGLVDMAMSLETPALLARDVATAAAATDALTGADAADPSTRGATPTRSADAVRDADADAGDLAVGVPREFLAVCEPEVAETVRRSLARLEAAGARLEDVTIPSLPLALPAYYVTNYAEFASAMQRFDGLLYGAPGEGATPEAAAAASRAAFGAEVKRRILLGTFVTQAEEADRWYEGARAVRRRLADEVGACLDACDVLVGPTMPTTPFPLGDRVADPLAMYAADVLTVPANLAGVPAGSVPARVADGALPVGVQVLGRAGGDERVLAAMRLIERIEHGGDAA